VPNLI